MYILRPLVTRMHRWMDHGGVHDDAAEVVELSPATTTEHMPAIALPNEFDKVVAFDEMSTPEVQLERLSAGQRTHGATLGYRLTDVLVFDGNLYSRKHVDAIRPRRKLPIVVSSVEERDAGQFCSNYVVERFFGHWLIDGLTLELLARDRELSPIAFSRGSWINEPGYRDLLSMQVEQVDQAHFRTLWQVDDRPINAGRIARLKRLRSILRTVAPSKEVAGAFIKRGQSGANRSLVNEAEVIEALSQQGFVIVDPESQPTEDIVRTLVGARLVVGVEGSSIRHAHMAMPEGGATVTIQPPTRFNAFSKVTNDSLGLTYAYTVGTAAEGGFHQPVGQLMKTIELALSAMQTIAMI